MRVISVRALRDFWAKHTDAEEPLRAWFKEAQRANWASTADVKARYPAASFVGKNRIVFNIKGNKYWLIVIFRPPHVFIRYLGTHSEYDRIDAATV